MVRPSMLRRVWSVALVATLLLLGAQVAGALELDVDGDLVLERPRTPGLNVGKASAGMANIALADEAYRVLRSPVALSESGWMNPATLSSGSGLSAFAPSLTQRFIATTLSDSAVGEGLPTLSTYSKAAPVESMSFLDRRMGRTPEEQIYGASVSGVTLGKTQVSYGLVGQAPEVLTASSLRAAERSLGGAMGPYARWLGLSFGGAESAVRGYFRSANIDEGWAPSSASGDAAIVNEFRTLGFADKQDIFDGNINRTTGAQFAGTKWQDWMVEASPVSGLLVNVRTKSEEISATGDLATLSTQRAQYDKGLTHLGFSRTETRIERKPDPNDAASTRQSDTSGITTVLDASQGIKVNGAQSTVSFQQVRSHTANNLTGELGTESRVTTVKVDQVQVSPRLSLGFNRVTTDADVSDTLTSSVSTYALNQLKLNDHAIIQGSLVRSQTSGNTDPALDGVTQDVWTLNTLPGQRMWLLSDRVGFTNALWQRVVTVNGNTTEKTSFGADTKVLGHAIAGTFLQDRVTDTAGTATQKRTVSANTAVAGFTVTGALVHDTVENPTAPTDRMERSVQISRPIGTRTQVGIGQSQVIELGSETQRRTSVNATHKLGPVTVSAAAAALETYSGIRRPESSLNLSYREDQPEGIRGGVTIINRADTDTSHGLMTREARATVPIGPVTLRGTLRENPELAFNDSKVATAGEQKTFGFDVPIGPVSLTVDRVENPTVVQNKVETFVGQTATDLALSAKIDDKGTVAIRNRFIEDGTSESLTNALSLDFQYKTDRIGLLSLAYYNNWGNQEGSPIVQGQGYRLKYARTISTDTSLELNLAKKFSPFPSLVDGLPDEDTRVFVEMKRSF